MSNIVAKLIHLLLTARAHTRHTCPHTRATTHGGTPIFSPSTTPLSPVGGGSRVYQAPRKLCTQNPRMAESHIAGQGPVC